LLVPYHFVRDAKVVTSNRCPFRLYLLSSSSSSIQYPIAAAKLTL
jgi:hypothetical protein